MANLLSLTDRVKDYFARRVPFSQAQRQAFKPMVQKAKQYRQQRPENVIGRQLVQKTGPVGQAIAGFPRGVSGYLLPRTSRVYKNIPEPRTGLEKAGRLGGEFAGFAMGPGKAFYGPIEKFAEARLGKAFTRAPGLVKKLFPAVGAEALSSAAFTPIRAGIEKKPLGQTYKEELVGGLTGRGVFGAAGAGLELMMGGIKAPGEFKIKLPKEGAVGLKKADLDKIGANTIARKLGLNAEKVLNWQKKWKVNFKTVAESKPEDVVNSILNNKSLSPTLKGVAPSPQVGKLRAGVAGEGGGEEALKATKAQIGKITAKKQPKQTLKDFYTNWVNRTQPVESLEKGVEKKLSASIRPEYSPTIQIKKLFGAGGKAELRHKQKLQPILDSVKNVAKEDFDAFMKAQRDVELSGRNIKGSDLLQAKQTLEALRGKYDINALETAANKLYQYQRENLDMLKQSGFLSDLSIKQITSVNQKYVPFERIMGEVDNYIGLPTSKLQQASQPIKKIKGSEKQILSPIESIIANTYKTEAAVAKNNVAKSIVGLKKILPELPITKSKLAQGAITVWEGGKKTYYQVPQEIEKVVKGLNEEAMDSLTKVLSAPARLLRQQATGRNLEFMIPNVVRDQFDAAINSKYGYKPFIGYFDGLRHMINYKIKGADDVVEAWINSGGKMFFESMEGRKAISQQISDSGRKSIIKRLGEWAVGGIETVGEFSESPTRIGLFKGAAKKTGNLDLAMMEAREGTLDFARRGAKMKTANALIPFLNVGVQGFDRMIRTVKNNPGGTALAVLAYGAVPATAVALYNNLFHGEDWKNVPDFEKQGNFVILTGGKDEEGNAKYIKIPKAYAQRYIANPIEEMITFAAGNNPQGFKQFALNYIGESLPILEGGSTVKEAISKTVGSNLPQFLKVPTQLAANYDFFRAKPIVPWYLENKPPAEQSYKSTEGVYKKIGQILDVSPLKVKNALESTFAGGVTQPKNIYKTVDAIVSGKKPSPNDLFVLRRFIGSYSGFDVERPTATDKKPLSAKILQPIGKAGAAEQSPLPKETEDLKVLYKDALSTVNKYAENKTKAQYGLVQKDLSEYQTEVDAAIKMKKQIEKERPEQVFEIELDTYKSGGGQNVEERAKWAVSKVKDLKGEELQKMINSLWDSKVLTGTTSGSAAYIKKNYGIDVGKYTGTKKGYGTKAKTKSKKKVTFKKVSPVKFTGKASFRKPAQITPIKKARIVKPEVSSVKYSL